MVTSDATGSTCVTGPTGGRVPTLHCGAHAGTHHREGRPTPPSPPWAATVRFTITIENTGQTPYTAAVVTDSLVGVLDDATYGSATTDRGSVALVDGNVAALDR